MLLMITFSDISVSHATANPAFTGDACNDEDATLVIEDLTSSNITSLAPNITYFVWAYVTNIASTAYAAIDTQAIPTATTDSATGVGTTGATLNGTVNANNESTTVTFEYGTMTAYGTTATADQSPVTGTTDTAVSKALTGLTPNTTYHFRVVGQNATGTTYGADMTFTIFVVYLPLILN